ncbi:YjjG family noncanonical pyrimidine nucleotidase [Lacticaseibacillus zhaodongensis]|uniref:YjjG family noncanonical pyrimidine nucleotidase n=1 Tax=Lacticaseibacillus zhaodongensis TaxID=2668065 RepID=UPI0012D2CB3B|nr:YjjG family noncanonical pyrimidine nucleotidase [Lacticaseibacillus zhaodongensis]
MEHQLIFDLDNTLLDFSATEARGLTQVFKDYNIPDTPAVRQRYEEINSALWAQLERGEISRSDIMTSRFATLLQELHRSTEPAQAIEHEYRECLNHGYERVHGAKTLLTQLQAAGYTIIAGTNGNSATQRARLKQSHLAPFFKGTYISEEIGYDKPAPQFFDAIFAAEPELDKHDTIMIGDGINSDIRGGVNYGLETIWVNLHNQANQSELHPSFEVQSLQELGQLLLPQSA